MVNALLVLSAVDARLHSSKANIVDEPNHLFMLETHLACVPADDVGKSLAIESPATIARVLSAWGRHSLLLDHTHNWLDICERIAGELSTEDRKTVAYFIATLYESLKVY